MIRELRSGEKARRYYHEAYSVTQSLFHYAERVWNALTMGLMEGIVVPRYALAVSVERGYVSVVLGRRFLSRIEGRKSGKYAFEEGKYVNPESLASALSLAKKSFKAHRAGIALSIPADWAVIRTVQLPSAVKDNISDVVGYELDRLTPFRQEDAYYDFRVLDEKDGKLQLLIVAARKDRLNPYLENLKEDGSLVDMVTVDVTGSGEGGDNGKAFGPAGDDISVRSRRALIEYLSHDTKGINLLGREDRRRVRAPLAVTFVLCALLLAIWIPYTVLPLQREEQRLAQIERQVSMRREEVRKVEALRKEVKDLTDDLARISEFKEARPAAMVILKELTTVLPKTVWTTRVKITETAVDLEGYAASASEVLPKLEESKYLRKVEFASPTMRDLRMNADRFVIKAEIEGVGKKEGEKPKDGKTK